MVLLGWGWSKCDQHLMNSSQPWLSFFCTTGSVDLAVQVSWGHPCPLCNKWCLGEVWGDEWAIGNPPHPQVKYSIITPPAWGFLSRNQMKNCLHRGTQKKISTNYAESFFLVEIKTREPPQLPPIVKYCKLRSLSDDLSPHCLNEFEEGQMDWASMTPDEEGSVYTDRTSTLNVICASYRPNLPCACGLQNRFARVASLLMGSNFQTAQLSWISPQKGVTQPTKEIPTGMMSLLTFLQFVSGMRRFTRTWHVTWYI